MHEEYSQLANPQTEEIVPTDLEQETSSVASKRPLAVSAEQLKRIDKATLGLASLLVSLNIFGYPKEAHLQTPPEQSQSAEERPSLFANMSSRLRIIVEQPQIKEASQAEVSTSLSQKRSLEMLTSIQEKMVQNQRRISEEQATQQASLERTELGLPVNAGERSRSNQALRFNLRHEEMNRALYERLLKDYEEEYGEAV